MNDDELGRILHDELHCRISPPDAAPEAVHEHLLELRSMQPVRFPGLRPTHLLRDLAGLAAVVAICALVAAGLFMRSNGPQASTAEAQGVEAFARIDSKTAWAESGSILYVTRDGGETWSTGSVPGGRSPAQLFGVVSSAASADGQGSAVQTPAPAERFPGHYYPDFIDAEHGWLLSWTPSGTSSGLTYAMTVWRTDDGGKSWTSTALAGTYKGLGVVQFVDGSHGWITILRTDYASAGSSQGSGSDSAAATSTPAVSIPPDATTILATTDGGVTWEQVSTLAALALPHFVSRTEAWGFAATAVTASPSAVIHTTDGGRTWQTSVLPIPSGGDVAGWPSPPAESNGSVVARLALRRTSNLELLTFTSADDGRTWGLSSTNRIDSMTASPIGGLSPLLDLPAGQPYALTTGDDPAAPTGIAATFDGGATWTNYSIQGLPSTGVSLAEWTSPDDLWVTTPPYVAASFELGGHLYATKDGGKTWKPLLGAPSPQPTASVASVPAPAESLGVQAGPAITGMGRIDASTGWVLVGDPSGADLLRFTQDGGATWSEARKAPPGSEAQFLDVDHGWTMSFGGTETSQLITIHRTTDGGTTWHDSTVSFNPGSGNAEWFLSMAFHFRDALHGELFATTGPMTATSPPAGSSAGWTCLRFSSADGGATWSEPASTPCLSEITLQDSSFGYASDALWAPVLYITTDGGQIWTRGSLPEGSTINSSGPIQLVQRRADGTLRALVSSGPGGAAAVVTSNDGGRTWTSAGAAQGIPANVLQVVALADDRWLAIGMTVDDSIVTRSLFSSDDGGLTWQKANAVNDVAAQPQLIDFASTTDGWLVMTDVVCVGSSNPPTCQNTSSSLYATTDGGATWSKLLTP